MELDNLTLIFALMKLQHGFTAGTTELHTLALTSGRTDTHNLALTSGLTDTEL